jgi:hypothetical protein
MRCEICMSDVSSLFIWFVDNWDCFKLQQNHARNAWGNKPKLKGE